MAEVREELRQTLAVAICQEVRDDTVHRLLDENYVCSNCLEIADAVMKLGDPRERWGFDNGSFVIPISETEAHDPAFNPEHVRRYAQLFISLPVSAGESIQKETDR